MTILEQIKYKVEVASGNNDDSFVHLESRNPDIDTSTDPEDIWDVGGTKVWQSSTQAFRFRSSSTDDDVIGNGARVLRVWYIGTEDKIAFIDYNTDGTTDVNITETGSRFLHAEVLEVGTYHGSNKGDITIEWASGVVVGKILIGVGKTQNSHYSIATDKMGIIQGSMSISANSSGIMELYKVENYMDRGLPVSPKILIMRRHFQVGVTPLEMEPIQLLPLTDVWARVAQVDSNNTDVSFNYSILLRPA